ncbi:MAG: hypothetical protein HYV67_03580 [Candidatus Taylorbacteria bacterium]|nr:hypothetical protein [Candidatus Taylorbacteria bacterium]
MNSFFRKHLSVFNRFLSTLFLMALLITLASIVNAAAPNPGHTISEIGNVVQGDILYGSATDVISALAKNTTATRYLSNTGASNNPAWAQVDLTNGITGILPTANGGTGIAYFTAAGPTAARIFTFPDAAATVLTSNAAVTVGQGGTALTAAVSDAVLVGDSTSAYTARALPASCAGTTAKLLYDSTTNLFSCGTDQTGAGGSPTPEATYTMFSTGRVMATDGVIMDLFNAAGSGQVIRILEVVAFQRTTAVTGIRAPVEIRKTSAVGTGGTAISAGKFDSTDTNLSANITARTAPTGGATLTGGFLGGSRILTEEAHLGTGAAGSFPWFQSEVPLYVNRGNTSAERIVLREGQGIACKWGIVVGTAAGLVACGITFQIGAATATEKPTYSWQSNSVGGASKKMIDIFNASGSGKILKITRISLYARQTAAVVGNTTPFEVYRTSAVGTGGTTITADKYDSSDAAVPAQITARDGPTGGATLSGGALLAPLLGTEELGDGTYYGHFRRAGVALNTPYVFNGSTTERQLTIREGEGITIQNGPLAATGNVVIIVEGTLE